MGPQGPILAALAKQQQGPQISAPGAGNMGDSIGKVTQLIALAQEAMKGLPPGTPLFKDLNQAIGRLSKHAAQGAPTAGNQMTLVRDLMRGIARNGFLARRIRAMEARMLPSLDGIVHVSRYMKKELEMRIPALRNIRNDVIPNFCRATTAR